MAKAKRHKQFEGEIRNHASIAMQDIKSSLQIMVEATESRLRNLLQNNLKEEVKELRKEMFSAKLLAKSCNIKFKMK